MPYLVLSVFLAILIYLPRLWVMHVLKKYSQPIDGMPGTGGELAKHLITRFELDDVAVEETTERNDHYDPAAKAVRLSPSHYNGKSLTAIAVAAHEVGHAIQFHRQEAVSTLRSRYLPAAMMFKKTGILLLTLLPVVGVLIRAPSAIVALILLSLGFQLIGAIGYLIVLPEEWDASFKKALPLLINGEYIDEKDVPAVNSILKAAALTYFASALADLVNIGRWLLILRR